MSARRSDSTLQTIAIVVMVFMWIWFFLGCSPQDIGVCDASTQQRRIQDSIIATQQRTIATMQSQIAVMSRSSAVHDSADRLCDSLVVAVTKLSHRVRVYDNPLDPHGRGDAQSILGIPR